MKTKLGIITLVFFMAIATAPAHAYEVLFNEDFDGGSWKGFQSPGIEAWSIEDHEGDSTWALWDDTYNYAYAGNVAVANSDYYNEAFNDTLWSPVINASGHENIYFGASLYWQSYYAADNGYILLKKQSTGEVIQLADFDEDYGTALDNGVAWTWEERLDPWLGGEDRFRIGFKADLVADSYYFQVDEVYAYGDAATVPVPGAISLIGSGLIALLGAARKNHKC